jgi:ATP-dependent Clp protease ATP-binding subunit ClpA
MFCCWCCLQERLKAVCVEVAESSRKIILFIDDIHNLVPNAAQQVGTLAAVAAASSQSSAEAVATGLHEYKQQEQLPGSS